MAVTVSFYNNFIEDVGKGNIKLNTDTFKCILVNGYTFNAAHDNYVDTSGELGTANGYTNGGAALTNLAWGWDAGLSATKWDADDVVWTILPGGDVGPATGAIIYSDTSSGDKLCLYIDFGGSETAGAATQFKIVFNTNGILTIG